MQYARQEKNARPEPCVREALSSPGLLRPCEAKYGQAREMDAGGPAPPLNDNLKRTMLEGHAPAETRALMGSGEGGLRRRNAAPDAYGTMRVPALPRSASLMRAKLVMMPVPPLASTKSARARTLGSMLPLANSSARM